MTVKPLLHLMKLLLIRIYIYMTCLAKGFLYSTVGCHPTRCSEFIDYKEGGPDAYFNALLQLATSSNNVVAIGECGLDYDRLHFCDKETQLKYFELQFDLAQKTQLPMFLHNRNTGQDFVNMVKANRHKFTEGVVHSFTGSLEEMQSLCELGLYIGVNGCSLKTQENLDVVKAIPEDKLMIETDAPWCDIRPTHASFAYLKNVSADEMKMYAPASKKKEKFEMGCMVKSRNEPCTLG
jgi:TatD DNase family protein